MKKGRFNKKIFLIVVLLLISLGYALLSSNLTINGNSKLASSTWDIHFDNVVPKEGRVTIGENESEAVINPNDNTEVTYNITLSKPGDFYEFNVDIVNAGSIDGQVERINSSLKIGDDDPFVINSDSSNLPPYLNYLITYSDDSEIMPNHLLKSGKSETIKVRIEFKRDIDSSILPPDDINIGLTIQPDLIQENEDAYNKGEEPYTPFTYDLDLDSIQNATIKYDAINQEKCVEYFSQDAPDEINVEAYCRGEVVTYNGNTFNIKDYLNDSDSDYLQELNDIGVITLKYIGLKSFDIDNDKCIDFLNNQGWYDNEEDKELYCSDQVASDGYSISIDANGGYLNELIEFGAIKNVEQGEIKPDVIITGYKEEVPSNLVIPRSINGKKVVGIADDSFDNKGITSVTIPNTVEYIGSNAFDNNNLAEVNVNGTDVVIGNCAFGDKESITTHNLPQEYFCVEGCATGSKDLYDGYEYSKGQYKYYYIEEDDGWGVYLANTNSTKPVTSKLCSMVDGKPITSMSWMFEDSNTTRIDFSSFDTSHVKNMSGMFSYMYNITELDLSTFNTSNVEDMSYMFYDSNNLEVIYAGNNFVTNNVNNSYSMFNNNDNLVGGKGTAYNEDYTDKEYAHIDEGEHNPGYFTKKGSLTVTLNPNGGVISRNKVYYDENEEIGNLPIPVREGKVFTGWYRDLECTIKIESDYIVDSNMELIAGWRDYENVQITFDKNNEDATGEMNNQVLLERTPTNLNMNEYSLDNHAFVGWNTKRDGTGTSYLDGAEITITTNITLYAQWLRVYTLTFDKNNNEAVGDVYTQTLLSGVATPISDDAFNAYTLTKKVIDNYNTETDNTGIKYYQSQSITITGDIVLFAHWESAQLLYGVLKNEAKKNGLAREYTGEHGDSMDSSKSTEKIYHWYAENDTQGTQILDKNNVIFAGQCWQMIRTTDTGGVKMIYNGEADDGKCLNTRDNHIGYGSRTTQSLTNNYWYGTDYIYDKENNVFSISGITEQAYWDAITGPNLVGKYTCKSMSQLGTCSSLYLVESYHTTSTAYVIPINPNSSYSQFGGELEFNVAYKSLADVGYMYNTKYSQIEREKSIEQIYLNNSLSTSYWYADSVTWGSPTANKYNLDNPYQVSSTSDYKNLVGKYTFMSTSQNSTSSTVYYIVAVNGSTMYYVWLSNSSNHSLEDINDTYTYGDSFIDNGNGTYTLTNSDESDPITINRMDWYDKVKNYSVIRNKYICKNAINNACSNLWYSTNINYYPERIIYYIKVKDNYKYSNGFEYRLDPDDNTYKYFLDDATSITFWDYNDTNNVTKLNNAHYTCWNEDGKCTTISYIYYAYSAVQHYINITDGKGVEDALNEMLFANNVNTKNSAIKSGVDAWYKKYIYLYDSYVEDTVFCNDRSIRNISGWNPNGGSVNGDITFKEYNLGKDLSCTNITDKFSVSNSLARLTYKVGLMTAPEINLLNNANVSNTGQAYWLGTPYYFNSYGACSYNVLNTGGITASMVWRNDIYSGGVRPAISLKPGTEYSSGDGSMANPYVVE